MTEDSEKNTGLSLSYRMTPLIVTGLIFSNLGAESDSFFSVGSYKAFLRFFVHRFTFQQFSYELDV